MARWLLPTRWTALSWQSRGQLKRNSKGQSDEIKHGERNRSKKKGKETTESRQAGRGQNIENVPFPPSRILVERRLNDATTTIAILLWRDEVIASPFRSRIARKSSILDRAFESRLVSLGRSLAFLPFLHSHKTGWSSRIHDITKQVQNGNLRRSCPWERV